jgi:hypothetical protein
VERPQLPQRLKPPLGGHSIAALEALRHPKAKIPIFLPNLGSPTGSFLPHFDFGNSEPSQWSSVTYFREPDDQYWFRRVFCMKLLNEHIFVREDALRVTALLCGIIAAVSATCQERMRTPLSLKRSEQQQRQADHGRCKDTLNSVDAGAYTVTVTDIIEGDTPGYRLAHLVLRFENLTDGVLALAYRSGSSFLVDNFKKRYSCCQTGPNPQDNSAVGIGIDRDGKVDSQFMLQARESDTVSFELWRHHPPEQQATSYQFAIMIDEIDPGDLKTVRKHPILTFRNLAARLPATTQPAP